MFKKTNSRKAISTVLTTMIIVVASVVLATGIVLFGTSTFQNKAQGESIITTGTQVWVDSANSGWAWGAVDTRNSGDKLISVDQIFVRGQTIPYGNWYANSSSTITTAMFQSKLVYTSMIISPNSPDGQLNNGTAAGFPLVGASCPNTSGYLIMQLASTQPSICLVKQNGPLSLTPGQKAIIYFEVPKGILGSIDASSPVSVSIYAHNSGAPVDVTAQSK